MSAYDNIPTTARSEPLEVVPRWPLAAILWVPLAVAFAAGIVLAAKFGHDLARSELEAIPNPAAANETMSAPIRIDPGDSPLIFAVDRAALEGPQTEPPGTEGSGTYIQNDPVTVRVIKNDGTLADVLIVSGEREGERYWTLASRLEQEASGPAPAPQGEGERGEAPAPGPVAPRREAPPSDDGGAPRAVPLPGAR